VSRPIPPARLTNIPSDRPEGWGLEEAGDGAEAEAADDDAARAARGPALARPASSRPMLPLGLAQRQHRVEAQLVDRSAVDAADERPGQPVHERVAKAPPQERPDGLVTGRDDPRHHDVEPHPRLLERREQPRRGERPDPRREHESEALGHRHEPPAMADEHAPRLLDPDELRPETELARQRDRRAGSR
jgi:hypothetical protein